MHSVAEWNIWQNFSVFLLKISQILCCGVRISQSMNEWIRYESKSHKRRAEGTRSGSVFSPYELVLTSLMSIWIPRMWLWHAKQTTMQSDNVRGQRKRSEGDRERAIAVSYERKNKKWTRLHWCKVYCIMKAEKRPHQPQYNITPAGMEWHYLIKTCCWQRGEIRKLRKTWWSSRKNRFVFVSSS